MATTFAFGQKNVRQTASNHLKAGKLDKALETINQCIQDPSTAQDAKSWFIRGNIYMEINNTQDPAFKALDADPLSKAMESYKKALEFDPKAEMEKKEFYGDIVQRLDSKYQLFFKDAVNAYNDKKYEEAMQSFENASKMLKVLSITDTLSLMNAALCAGLANDRASAKKYYIELLEGNYKSPNVYLNLSDLYLKDKDSTNAFKYIRMGLKQYPSDQSLFNGEINIYLTFNIIEKAMKNLVIAMEKDPSNYTLPYALGTLYDVVASDETKPAEEKSAAFINAEKSYKKAIELKPDYFDAIFNLGVLNLNKASEGYTEANNLPPDAVDKYKQMKGVADGYANIAADYFEKAITIQPDDMNSLNALRQIYTQLQQPEKKKIVTDKINALQHK